ncbi:metal-binding protein [Pedobacter sp. HMF7647]|uniref:Metal-binding protein n=1 Tax=Hufsiella arboris TaxID=2695275 RepID=A0A7K1YEP6_9SPHI|nr:Ada metal-binding domain-containing protein [Hufsiella arboris]MXV52861.1 metal-binding protein [Hufsiella arboris]
MIEHIALGIAKLERARNLKVMMDNGEVTFAGNRNLKIFGGLKCDSGKRMKVKNRVFFRNKEEALSLGYRPCGHCLKSEYILWKKNRED